MLKLVAAFVLFAVGAGSAAAQENASVVLKSEVIGPRGAGGGHRLADHQAQQVAPVSLVQAIVAAESHGQGRAIRAGFEDDGKGGHYEVKVLSTDRKLIEYDVHAVSGQVTSRESRPIEGFFLRVTVRDIQTSPLTLLQAISMAEQRVGGRAAEAEVGRTVDKVRYVITVATGDRSREVWVEAKG